MYIDSSTEMKNEEKMRQFGSSNLAVTTMQIKAIERKKGKKKLVKKKLIHSQILSDVSRLSSFGYAVDSL